MKLKNTVTFLLLLSINLFGQSVTIEDRDKTEKKTEKTAEQKKVEDWIALEAKYHKTTEIKSMLFTTGSKQDYKDVIEHNNSILFFIESNRMLTKCKEVDGIRTSWGESYQDNCKRVRRDIEFIKSANYDAETEIKNMTARGEESNKPKNVTLGFGNKKGKNNDDDFWNGKTESTEETTKNSDDDFWNGKSEKVADSNNVDDFWNGKGELSNKNNNEVKNFSNNSGEIIRDNNANYAIKDKQGSIVIPFGKYLEISYLDLNNKQFFIVREKKSIRNQMWNINVYNNQSIININGDVIIDKFNNYDEWQETIDGKGVKRYVFYYVKNIRYLRSYKKSNRYNENGYLWYVDYELDRTASFYNVNMEQYKTEDGVYARTSLKSHWGK